MIILDLKCIIINKILLFLKILHNKVKNERKNINYWCMRTNWFRINI